MDTDQAAPCRHAGVLPESIVQKAVRVIVDLANDTTFLAKHGLSPVEYQEALPLAIERIRGQSAARTTERRQLLAAIFRGMQQENLITSFDIPKHGDDTIYRLRIPSIGDVAIIQKGCPDGTHSSVSWTVPDWAAETFLWWSCPSLAREPGTHISLGVSRLRPKFLSACEKNASGKMIDGVIFHNELCGSVQRPCPKQNHSIELEGYTVPPPCIYVLPQPQPHVSEWNWNGGRQLQFPLYLLKLFGLDEMAVPTYTGYVGFQRRGDQTRSTISARFGMGRSTVFRS